MVVGKIRFCLLLHDDYISWFIFLYLHGKCIVNNMFSSFSMHESCPYSQSMREFRKFCQRGPTLKTFLRRPKGRRSNIALALNYSPIRSIFKL